METKKNEIKVNDKVRTRYGTVETVIAVEGCSVITYESMARNCWYHHTKVTKIN